MRRELEPRPHGTRCGTGVASRWPRPGSRAASPSLVCVRSRWRGREEGVRVCSAWGFERGARGRKRPRETRRDGHVPSFRGSRPRPAAQPRRCLLPPAPDPDPCRRRDSEQSAVQNRAPPLPEPSSQDQRDCVPHGVQAPGLFELGAHQRLAVPLILFLDSEQRAHTRSTREGVVEDAVLAWAPR